MIYFKKITKKTAFTVMRPTKASSLRVVPKLSYTGLLRGDQLPFHPILTLSLFSWRIY
jgi:hypothetical protein